ncbi:MAG: type IV pilus biogenesis protein PilM [Oceanisphaera sp.]|uniref:type IV pilus biogenesis protein PilM n=1 Tax=Oceanisphaera sp. TaxID=1929979 RepID=UPI003F9BA209
MLREMFIATFRPSSASHTVIGIDFGCHYIKALALTHHTNKIKLEGIASVATPPGAIIDYQVYPIPPLIEALKLLKTSLNIRSRQVVTALSGSSVTTKVVHVPALFTGDVLALHMQQEALQHLASELDEISLDYEVLGPSEPSAERNKVLLSVARTEHIQARVDVLRQVGWQTKIVDIGSHALARAVAFLWPECLALRIAVLDIGAHSMTFTVLEQGEVIHHRLQSLVSDTALSLADSPVFAAQSAELIVQQVQRNIQLYCSHTGHEPPAQCCLFGGDPALPLLAEQLTEELSVCVMQADFSHVFDMNHHQGVQVSTYGTALGLALRRGVPCRI